MKKKIMLLVTILALAVLSVTMITACVPETAYHTVTVTATPANGIDLFTVYNGDTRITGTEGVAVDTSLTISWRAASGFTATLTVGGVARDATPDSNGTRVFTHVVTANVTISITASAESGNVQTATISFDSTGGSSVADITANVGATVETRANPTRTGYTFSHWSLSAEGEEFTIPATMPADGLSLFAVWDLNEYTITFNEEGGSAVSNIIQDFNTAVNPPSNPTRANHEFSHWSLAADGTVHVIPTHMPAGGLTLFAVWTPNSYTINFNMTGGTAVEPMTRGFGTAISAPAANRTGHTLRHWSLTEGGAAFTFPATMPANGIAMLFAVWDINQYTITFNEEGGSAVSNITQNFNTAVTAPSNPTKTGHEFSHWSRTVDGAAYAIPTNMPAGGLTLFAVWDINEYTISFDSRGGSAVSSITQNFNTTVTAPTPNPTQTGHIFSHWSQTIDGTAFTFTTMPAGGLTLYAVWNANEYTITFNMAGGNAVSNITQNFGTTVTAPATVKAGHTFLRWSLADGGEAFTFPTTMPAGGLTLFAVWEANQYTLTFNLAGGAWTAELPVQGAFNSYAVIPNITPTRTNHIFTGWLIGETVYQTGETTAVRIPVNGLTFTAQWQPAFNIEFVTGLQGITLEGTINEVGASVTVPNLNSERWYLVLAGWQIGGAGEVFAAGESISHLVHQMTVGGTLTLHAVWYEYFRVYFMTGEYMDLFEYYYYDFRVGEEFTLWNFEGDYYHTLIGWRVNGEGATHSVLTDFMWEDAEAGDTLNLGAVWRLYFRIAFVTDRTTWTFESILREVGEDFTIILPAAPSTEPNSLFFLGWDWAGLEYPYEGGEIVDFDWDEDAMAVGQTFNIVALWEDVSPLVPPLVVTRNDIEISWNNLGTLVESYTVRYDFISHVNDTYSQNNIESIVAGTSYTTSRINGFVTNVRVTANMAGGIPLVRQEYLQSELSQTPGRYVNDTFLVSAATPQAAFTQLAANNAVGANRNEIMSFLADTALANVSRHSAVNVRSRGYSSAGTIVTMNMDVGSDTIINFNETGGVVDSYRIVFASVVTISGSLPFSQRPAWDRAVRRDRVFFDSDTGMVHSQLAAQSNSNRNPQALTAWQNAQTQTVQLTPYGFFGYIINPAFMAEGASRDMGGHGNLTLGTVQRQRIEFNAEDDTLEFSFALNGASAGEIVRWEHRRSGGITSVTYHDGYTIALSFRICAITLDMVSFRSRSWYNADAGIPVLGIATTRVDTTATFEFYNAPENDIPVTLPWRGVHANPMPTWAQLGVRNPVGRPGVLA